MRKIGLPLVTVLLTAVDQLVKWWIVTHIALNGNRPFIPYVLSLSYLRNYGAAYSLLQHQQTLFAIVTVVVLGAALYYLVKNLYGSPWLLTSLVLIIAGGLGNFIDRLRLGYVVDMFQTEFMDFPIFNVADAYLTIGVLLLFIWILKEG